MSGVNVKYSRDQWRERWFVWFVLSEWVVDEVSIQCYVGSCVDSTVSVIELLTTISALYALYGIDCTTGHTYVKPMANTWRTLDAKWLLDQHSCCPLPVPVITTTTTTLIEWWLSGPDMWLIGSQSIVSLISEWTNGAIIWWSVCCHNWDINGTQHDHYVPYRLPVLSDQILAKRVGPHAHGVAVFSTWIILLCIYTPIHRYVNISIDMLCNQIM